MSNASPELPLDVKQVIDEPPTPFDRLQSYHHEPGIYELDRRPEVGYDVVLLYHAHSIGNQVLSTRVEWKGQTITEIDTPVDRGLDRFTHTFPNIDPEVSEIVIPRAA